MIRLISSSRSLVLGLVLASAGTVACGGGGGDNITGPPNNGGGSGGSVAVGSVVLGSTAASIQRGGSVTLTASARDAAGNALSGRTITWTTSDANIAVVSSTGVVTGQGPGTAMITATSEGKAAYATVTVTPPPVPVVAAVASVSVTPSSGTVLIATVKPMDTIALAATLKDAGGNVLTGRQVVWTSSDTTATVSQDGIVTGRSAGTATITASSEGKSAMAVITVTRPAIAKLVVSPTDVTLKVGATVTLSITLLDDQGNELKRTIGELNSDGSIISVSAGVITGLAPGNATVSISASGVKTVVVNVTVTS